MMDLLKRELAPILPEAFAAIDAEAKRVLVERLAARKVVDFRGPFGWGYAAVGTGRLKLCEKEPVAGVSVGVRTAQALVEMRTPIVIDLMELDAVARGADDLDLTAVIEAAERIAGVEDGAVFHGYPEAGIDGIVRKSPHQPVRVSNVSSWPLAVVQAEEVLRGAGITGPYVLCAGPREYDELAAGAEDGYPILKRIERQILDHAVIWAPALDGAVLLTVRGGDYELTVGQDFSVGYAFHDKHRVELFLTESFTFRVLEPRAAVPIRRA